MIIGCADQYGRKKFDIECMDPRRNKLKLDVSSKLKLVIKKFAMDQKWNGAFQMVGCTSH